MFEYVKIKGTYLLTLIFMIFLRDNLYTFQWLDVGLRERVARSNADYTSGVDLVYFCPFRANSPRNALLCSDKTSNIFVLVVTNLAPTAALFVGK